MPKRNKAYDLIRTVGFDLEDLDFNFHEMNARQGKYKFFMGFCEDHRKPWRGNSCIVIWRGKQENFEHAHIEDILFHGSLIQLGNLMRKIKS